MTLRGKTLQVAATLLLSSTAVLGAVGPWGQCGGKEWHGETTCVSGWTCKYSNDYYSQCLEGSPDPEPTTAEPEPTTAEPEPTTADPTPTDPTTLSTVIVTSTAKPSPTPSPSSPPNVGGSGKHGAKCNLDAAFKAKGKKYIGVATDQGLLQKGSNAEIIQDNFGQVTPENSMKWDATEGSQGSFTLGTADYLVNWATTNKKYIRGHTTVWHSQLPNWVSSIRDKTQLQTVMVNHINKLIGGYKGKVYAWDVINEMFSESGGFRSSVFYNVLGEDFVSIAFKAARAADPNAKLYINDYNLDSATYSKTKGFASYVKKWVAAGVPIDGVGSQSHLSGNWPISDIPGALKLICADVSECAMTELDIKGASTSDYQSSVKACLNESKCIGVTVWGISDSDSWLSGDKPLLFDGSFNAKAAYNGLCSILV
ncbi:endoxylanase [Phaeosphaeriaceae sp. SRC1lsM3a]|nr:endoxylanase [Stagonospora sp. SRC1lsM3a]